MKPAWSSYSYTSICRLSERMSQELLSLLQEIQDKDLTWAFLSKADGDLSSCSLNWEVLHYLLQQSSAQTITVNLRKNRFLQENIPRLLPFLDSIVFKRFSVFVSFIPSNQSDISLSYIVMMHGSCFFNTRRLQKKTTMHYSTESGYHMWGKFCCWKQRRLKQSCLFSFCLCHPLSGEGGSRLKKVNEKLKE